MDRKELIQSVLSSHEKVFDVKPAHTSITPARVNIIGEHTDYNDGFVLPAAINFYTCISGTKRGDNIVKVRALDFDDQDDFELNTSDIQKSKTLWKNFIRGAFQILAKMDHPVAGCNLTISGTIPKGAGLSSSASLEVCLLSVLSDMFELNLSKLEMALIGQKIENEYVGLSCGIMDQLSVACGQKNKALLIDCKDYSIEPVEIPSSLSILIVNSNVKRELTTSGYNDRRNECIKACELLNIKSLRDMSIEVFNNQNSNLPAVTVKRAKHVITENQRVQDTVAAFNNNDIGQVSDLMQQSHQSMQYDYEITVPEIDLLVRIISDIVGKQGGARMTGGGFGGCVVTLLPHALIQPVIESIETKYKAKTAIKPSIYVCKPSAGVCSL